MAIELVQNQVSVLEGLDVAGISSMMNSITRFQAVIQKTLKKGHDYDVIPGTQKPTLLKPGAEKTLMLLGLTSEYEIIEKIEDYDREIFAYTIKCILSRNGTKITEGVGNCNSKEDRYRWRWVKEEDLPIGADAESLKKRTNQWNQVQYRIENEEVCSQTNTILKMAKKRAQVDATLTVAALSEVFTQDIEDMREMFKAEAEQNIQAGDGEHIRVTFGKYKGRTLGEIAEEDISYVEWLAANAREDVMRKAAEMVLEDSKAEPEPKASSKPAGQPKTDGQAKPKAGHGKAPQEEQEVKHVYIGGEQESFADDVELPF